MSDAKITTFWYKFNRNNSRYNAKVFSAIRAKKDSLVSMLSGSMEGSGEKFSDIMMKVSIAKLALALVTLIVMTILLIKHLHVFDPITIQFSEWVTSPIICFILLILMIKFIGLSVGLALTFMSIKKITFCTARIRLIGYGKSGLCYLIRKKVQHQKA
ncbi:diacylglycerol kinase gamma [Candidatus Scalindua japonica]|uniref:Diacylglycerol kinase gamma n=1 Tax=Candidatus Scalindua japonica TaxID=1284222 RepID=A0A286TUN1_9BACT|nr:hypothetical protein [Candidatus Scalindua japonica]GAX59602.1 diacylglycerol kinase gamma [Candidatus Scalindua japonica]